MVIVHGEDMDIKYGEKMGKRKGFGGPVYGTWILANLFVILSQLPESSSVKGPKTILDV